jgi:TetR/AcrR family transcriptional repressor of lmrAB and yxaGH operons
MLYSLQQMARVAGNRDRILDAAWELFWQGGYHATSIADIAKRARLPKGSIYNYFTSKDELLEAALLRLRYQYETQLRVIVLAGTHSPQVLVEKLLDHYAAEYGAHGFGRGDPLGSRLNELADTNPQLTAELTRLLAAWRSVLTQKIWAYATVAQIPELVEKADGLAGMIQAALQGVLLQMKALKSVQPLEDARHFLVPMVSSYVSALASGDV